MHKKNITMFLLLSFLLMGCNGLNDTSSSTQNNSTELSTSTQSSSQEPSSVESSSSSSRQESSSIESSSSSSSQESSSTESSSSSSSQESSSTESSSSSSSQESSYDDSLRLEALAKAANHQIAEDYDVTTSPKSNGILDTSGKYVKNSDTSGMVYDTNGNPIAYNICASDMTVYYGAAYISLEAVVAYIYAFGELPVNYDYSNYRNAVYDAWGRYGRLYGTKVYSNDVSKYPNEPELPGGTTQYNYRECDIGSSSYYGGSSYVRGVYRICWTTDQKPGEDRYVFYSINHYCAFQEYLNYEGGWGKRFGFKSSSVSNDTTPSIKTYPEVIKRNIVF